MNYTAWTPEMDAKSRDVGEVMDTVVAAEVEPVHGASSDVFSMERIRVNPKALKGEDESDSDDDIKHAFH